MTDLKNCIEMRNLKNWDAESQLHEFECTIDTLDKIRDGISDDISTMNALSLVHSNRCELYRQFKDRLLSD